MFYFICLFMNNKRGSKNSSRRFNDSARLIGQLELNYVSISSVAFFIIESFYREQNY